MVMVGSSGHPSASKEIGMDSLFVLELSFGGELGTDSEGII